MKILFFTLFLFSMSANAFDFPFTTELEGQVEYMNFKEESEPTKAVDENISFLGRFKLLHEADSYKVGVGGFFRYDLDDNKRNFILPEDTYFKTDIGDYGIYVGTKVFNYSSTEMFHPADGINSIVMSGNLSKTEKIGEPVISFDMPLGDGDFSLMYFPSFIPSIFPNEKSRLGFGFKMIDPQWISKDNEVSDDLLVHQWGARVTQSFETTDLSLHFLHHIDRQTPMITVDTITYSKVAPLFSESMEIGGTYQQVFESGLILKSEATYKSFMSDAKLLSIYGVRTFEDHSTVAVSGEYGFSHLSGADSTFIAEAQSVFGVSKSKRTEMGLFTRDFLLGYRFAFNDIRSNQIFVGGVVDLERSHEYLGVLDYSIRINNFMKFEGGFRYIDAPKKNTVVKGLEMLDRDSNVYFNIIGYY